MKLAICLLFTLMCLIAVSSARRPGGKPSRDDQWKKYLNRHGKKHHSSAARRQRWEKNINDIEKHNEEAVRGMHTYTKIDNHLADMMDDELNALTSTTAPDSIEGEVFQPEREISSRQIIPTSRNYAATNCMPPVKNQIPCGACWSFAANTPVEYSQCIKNRRYTFVTLSEQQLIDCSAAWGNLGCNGGFYTFAWSYAKLNGMMSSSAYPFTAVNGSCAYKSSDIVSRVSSFSWVPRYNETALQLAVATRGPVAASIYVTNNLLLYKAGIYSDPTCQVNSVNHAVVIVGYGSDQGTDYWIVRNSWGRAWGMNGYFFIKRGVNMCNIAAYAAFPTIV